MASRAEKLDDKIVEGWLLLTEPMDKGYPYDGQPVWLTADYKEQHPAVWRTTRSYDAPNVKWVYDSFWAKHNAGGQRIDFVPVAYKRMEV
jgi:hypothetical protein